MRMMDLFSNKENCCGCTACKSICPRNAILMQVDREGFLYPSINEDLCNGCGLCTKVCAFREGFKMEETLSQPLVYAAKHKSREVRMTSTSGGAFVAMSDFVLEKGGIIYGVAFDEEFNVCHYRAGTSDDRDKFKGSKYVQSDLRDTYKEVKQDLLYGKYVLFTGTPCQTAGLHSFLQKMDISRLFLCDIICHGVPSPLMWKEHITLLENKYKCNISKYYFRPKFQGWHVHNELCILENGKMVHTNTLSQNHKRLYYLHLIMRPSCHNCKFTNYDRASDFTIADFRGIEKSMPEFDDFEGVSLMLINTLKGQMIFDKVKGNIEYKESNTADCVQPQLQQPCKPHSRRNEFWDDYYKHSYTYVIRKYAGYGNVNIIKRFLKKNIKWLLIKLNLFNNISGLKKIYRQF